MKFEDCIKSFLDENGSDNFNFTLNGENIEVSKELNKLGIKNNDVIKAEQIQISYIFILLKFFFNLIFFGYN